MLKIRQAEDNFKCDVCGQTFDMHKSSVRHILKDQQAKDSLACDVCDITIAIHKGLHRSTDKLKSECAGCAVFVVCAERVECV